MDTRPGVVLGDVCFETGFRVFGGKIECAGIEEGVSVPKRGVGLEVCEGYGAVLELCRLDKSAIG